MKKHLCAGLLAATLAVPVLAAQGKTATTKPAEPLSRIAVIACIGLLVGLHAYARYTQEDRDRRDHMYQN